VAEDLRYSRDLCSYFRIDYGHAVSGKTPLGKMVKPDVVIACNNICGTVQNWFKIVAEHFGVPFLLLDTPFADGPTTDADVTYVEDQLRQMGKDLGRILGREVTERRLRPVVERSREALILWRDVRMTAASRPAPFTSFDAFVHMAPIVSMRGTRRVLAYYKRLLAELKERQAAGQGAIPDERARVVWDNIAIWPVHRELKKFFKASRVALVADTYTGAWAIGSLDENDPFHGLARSYCDIILNHGQAHRVDLISAMLKDYDAQGFILHSNRSCKRYSLGQYGVRKIVTARTGAPGVVVEADMADPRSVSYESITQRLTPFFEMIGGGA
jgi:benzoyl-CoA reductase/2-hydroxyglutaryl-CoA dehydratase subunit BcrC/BadD/HgdB